MEYCDLQGLPNTAPTSAHGTAKAKTQRDCQRIKQSREAGIIKLSQTKWLNIKKIMLYTLAMILIIALASWEWCRLTPWAVSFTFY